MLNTFMLLKILSFFSPSGAKYAFSNSILNQTHAINSASPTKSITTGCASIKKKKQIAKIKISIANSNVKITKYCGTFMLDCINFGNKNISPSSIAQSTAPHPKLAKIVKRAFGKLKTLTKVKASKEHAKNRAITKRILYL